MSELDAILKKLNKSEKKIFGVIFWHQRKNTRGIRSNKLRNETPIKGSMNKNAFLKYINNLIEFGLLEKEESGIKGRYKQTYYRIKKEYFDIMCKESDNIEYLYKTEAKLFSQSILNYESDKYAVSVIEFLFGRLIVLAINSMRIKDDDIRDTFYYDMWEKIKDLIDSLHIKTLKNKEEKKKARIALLELLEPYSSRSIGKQVMLDKIYDEFKEELACLE